VALFLCYQPPHNHPGRGPASRRQLGRHQGHPEAAPRFAKPPLKHLRQIAIDEINIGRGQRYLTVVLDLDSGAVVFIGEGGATASLEPCWKRLRSSRTKTGPSPPT